MKAVKNDNTMIYRGTKDMGNAFYVDCVIGNLEEVAVWHNAEEKGGVVEALLGLAWIQSNTRKLGWAGDILALQLKLSVNLMNWEQTL